MSGRTLQEIRIFLASPGDVTDERDRVRGVVEELNRGWAGHQGLVLRAVGWETDAAPDFGGDPQSLLNGQIARMEDYDFFVGIMWNRFGASTPRAGSGTEEELRRAVESFKANNRPSILLYFGQKPFNLRSQADIEQKGKVLAFKTELQSQGLYWEYDDVDDFEKLFREHLQNHLMRRLPRTPPPVPVEAGQIPGPVDKPARAPAAVMLPEARATAPPAITVEDSGPWVLLGDTFYESENVTDKGEGTVVLEVAPSGSEQRAALSALRRTGPAWHSNGPLAYAHGDDAGTVRVEQAESRSTGGRSIWTVTLKLDPDEGRNNAMSEMGFNNFSSDQLAEMRARLLLLDERPKGSSRRGGSIDINALMITAALQTKTGILPEFWQRYRSRPDLFLPLARLWAIYHLKLNLICEHVLELRLGPLEPDDSVDVVFRGRRRRRYSNEPALEIGFEGRCALKAAGKSPGRQR